MDSRAIGRFLLIGPIVVGIECLVAHVSGWTHATLLASWRGAVCAVVCWEWGALAWAHGWLRSGGARRLLKRLPHSRVARRLLSDAEDGAGRE